MFQFFCFAFVISSAKQWFCSPVSLVSITNISPCPLPFLSAREVSKRANSPVCILFEKQYTAINCPLSVTDNLSSLLTLQSSSASLVFLDTSNEFNEFSEQTTVVSSVFSDKSREVNLFCLQYNSMRFLLVNSDKTDNSLGDRGREEDPADRDQEVPPELLQHVAPVERIIGERLPQKLHPLVSFRSGGSGRASELSK